MPDEMKSVGILQAISGLGDEWTGNLCLAGKHYACVNRLGKVKFQRFFYVKVCEWLDLSIFTEKSW